MPLRNMPIQRKLMRVMLLTCGAMLLVTCSSFFAYEFITFRQATIREVYSIGEIIGNNSTGALAFDNRDDASEILTSLEAQRHIVLACLYDRQGNLFSTYPENFPVDAFPSAPGSDGYTFEKSHLSGFQAITQGSRRLGTLYIKSDMRAMYERFQLYGAISGLIIVLSFLMAYFLSRSLQKGISKPIMVLAETAKAISIQQDYSIRATKLGDDELGFLTDSFNQMLTRIQTQNLALSEAELLLEQKVIERTKELEIANKELEAFTYSVSHDLRAPLRSIGGFARVLEEDYGSKLSDEGKKVIHTISKNASRMGRLIDDMLHFSRVGRVELSLTSIKMSQEVDRIIEELLPLEAGRLIDIRVADLGTAVADINMLRQVWINLISNAFKYTRKKKDAQVEIGSFNSETELCYYVKDNGSGFDMQYVHKLFGVFQRLHRLEDFDGTGVGLAIVKRIIDRHGGRVWAEAELDKGATFYFSLPK